MRIGSTSRRDLPGRFREIASTSSLVALRITNPTFRKPKRSSKLRVRYDPEDPGRSEAVMPLWVELALATGGVAAGAALVLFGLSGLTG